MDNLDGGAGVARVSFTNLSAQSNECIQIELRREHQEEEIRERRSWCSALLSCFFCIKTEPPSPCLSGDEVETTTTTHISTEEEETWSLATEDGSQEEELRNEEVKVLKEDEKQIDGVQKKDEIVSVGERQTDEKVIKEVVTPTKVDERVCQIVQVPPQHRPIFPGHRDATRVRLCEKCSVQIALEGNGCYLSVRGRGEDVGHCCEELKRLLAEDEPCPFPCRTGQTQVAEATPAGNS